MEYKVNYGGKIYHDNQNCVHLHGIKSEYFGITQGVVAPIFNIIPDFCRWFNEKD